MATFRLPSEQLPAVLEPILRQRLPSAESARIRNWSPSPRGFATETFLFEAADADSALPLVFRRPPEMSLFPDYDLLRQVLVMKRLAATGLPVPTVRWLDRTDAALGTPYFVMDRLEGEAPSDYPSYHVAGNYYAAGPEQRTRMWMGCVDTIATVHQLDWRALGLDFLRMPQHGSSPVDQIVNYLDSALTWAADEQPPIYRRAIEWLRANRYEPEHITLCWGDARMSNILYDKDFDVVGVLDWEIAYIGDHEADIGWLLFLDWASSEFEGHPPLPGTPTRDETIARYEAKTGMPIRNLRYNEVLAAVLLSVPLLRMANRVQLPPEMNITGFCTARIEQLIS